MERLIRSRVEQGARLRKSKGKWLALPPARMQWLWLEHAVPLDRSRQELPEDMRMLARGARIDENEAAKFPCCPHREGVG